MNWVYLRPRKRENIAFVEHFILAKITAAAKFPCYVNVYECRPDKVNIETQKRLSSVMVSMIIFPRFFILFKGDNFQMLSCAYYLININ